MGPAIAGLIGGLEAPAALLGGVGEEVHVHAHAALGAHFGGRTGDACRAHVLHTDDSARRNGFQTGFEQQFFLKRVAYLNGGEVFMAVFR